MNFKKDSESRSELSFYNQLKIGCAVVVSFFIFVMFYSMATVDLVRVDQCMRAKLFQQCVDKRPVNSSYHESIEACGDMAYNQSLRKESQIKQECIA